MSNPTMDGWRETAMQLPEVNEGTSCNNAAFKARKKNFFFMGSKEHCYTARLKLGDSLGEAEKYEKKSPEVCNVGKGGWVLLTFATDDTPPDGLVERWIEESYRLLAPKTLVKQLDA